MNIDLASVDENYLKSKVDEGYYVDMAEAVRDAVRRMREAESFSQDFYDAIMVGERQIATGQYKPYTPELMEELRQNARARAARGERPSPDVIPR